MRNTGRHFLALADGTVFYGRSRGAAVDTVGEVVFNTGMTGYQEIVSDPSYAGQFVTLTVAEVGNYGCNAEDMESRGFFLRGLVVQELNEPSNFRSTSSLTELLRSEGVPVLSDVDTRRLVMLLRSGGTQKAFLHGSEKNVSPEDGIRLANEWCGLDGQDYASEVSVAEPFEWNDSGDLHVVVYDFGVKYNILRLLGSQNLRLTVVPAGTAASSVLAMNPDGVFLSNGPADPSAVKGAIDAARTLIGKIPIMGICLGHQILGIASGCECGRLKFGHHGCNHPVKDMRTGEVSITSQNHNFALGSERFPEVLEVTHINLNDQTIEGIRHRHEPMFSVQYHPESAPGPHDAAAVFKEFRKLLER